ncbi:hypothetical protein ACFV30_44225 [Streptomyces sp. NPDC059752]|uniref:hypothetical protein n=1 Tax=unclassified Streptomyces TaxID=2593676 RepID=UPI0036656B9E
MTTDPDKARERLEDWTDITGVEGLVVQALNQRYRPGTRNRTWTKIRRRTTAEANIGAITGTLIRPRLLLIGRHAPTGRLRPPSWARPRRRRARRSRRASTRGGFSGCGSVESRPFSVARL